MIYSQTTGVLRKDDGTVMDSAGYAGYGLGVNNHSAESIAYTGPLPCGVYDCGDLVTNNFGTDVFSLNPDPTNRMFGRSGFLCHDNNPTRPPRSSSDGCIVNTRAVRLAMKATKERLHVVP